MGCHTSPGPPTQVAFPTVPGIPETCPSTEDMLLRFLRASHSFSFTGDSIPRSVRRLGFHLAEIRATAPHGGQVAFVVRRRGTGENVDKLPVRARATFHVPGEQFGHVVN